MKRRINPTFLSLTSAFLLSMAPVTIPADEDASAPDTSKWSCRLCPISSGWFGSWDLGLIYVDDPTPRFADYRGMLDKDFYLEASGDSSYRNEAGYYFDFVGTNLGLSSRRLAMRGGKQGLWEARAHYQEIPRYLGNGTTTPYQGVGTDRLTLAGDWKSQPFQPATLERKWEAYGAGLTIRASSAWKLDADYERQNRSGTQAFGGAVFAVNAAWFPAPLDMKTDILNAGVEYNADRGQLRLAFYGSDFSNDNASVTWDNPFTFGSGTEVSRSALAPDNSFHQFALTGAYRFSNRFRISGKATMGEAKQDMPFLPYSIAEEYQDIPLPRSSLDGKLETSMYNLSGRVYILLADRLDLTAAYKADERDNKTPVDTYTPVIMEIWPAGPRSNRPYSYDRSQALVELRWRPVMRTRLQGGFKREKLERTYQEIRKAEEDTLWAEFQFAPWFWLDTRLRLERLDRETSEHSQQGNYDRAENPLMRKFNMADRKRDRGVLEIDLFPIENLSFNFSYYATDDDYERSVIGLTAAEESSINLDVHWTPVKSVTLYGFVTQDEIEAEMSGSPDEGRSIWDGTTEDEITTWGVGFTGDIGDKWAWGLDYVNSKSEGEILVLDDVNTDPFPVLKTNLKNTRIFLKYRATERWGLALDAYREQYNTSDWFIDGYAPLDIPGLLTLGQTSPDYDVYVVRLMANITF